MEDYCRIFIDIRESDAFVTSLKFPEKEKNKLTTGELIDEKVNIDVELKNKTKNYPDLMGDTMRNLIISEKFKQLLELIEEPKKIQFIPVDVSGKKYFLLNILNVISCFNWEQSKYTTFSNPKVLDEVTHLVLNKEPLKGVNIFRMKEEPFPVFISRKLHDALVDYGITGVEFIYTMDLTVDFDS
ncbi:MAG: hypothetical protein KF746_21060 [Chitinophagaceae bacterium]|nr:hypothetical protein [Chitinophagaceae bacterium]